MADPQGEEGAGEHVRGAWGRCSGCCADLRTGPPAGQLSPYIMLLQQPSDPGKVVRRRQQVEKADLSSNAFLALKLKFEGKTGVVQVHKAFDYLERAAKGDNGVRYKVTVRRPHSLVDSRGSQILCCSGFEL